MSHYPKVIMDTIWGRSNFRNEIVWKWSSRSDGGQFGRVHDVILYYTKSGERVWNDQYVPLDPNYVKKSYQYDGPLSDKFGPVSSVELTGPGINPNDKQYKGWNPADSGRHWSVPRTGNYAYWIEENVIPNYRSIVDIYDRLDALDAAGLIRWSSNGVPRLNSYLAASKGEKVSSIWSDIPMASGNERTGYPTQKPLKLLELSLIHI